METLWQRVAAEPLLLVMSQLLEKDNEVKVWFGPECKRDKTLKRVADPDNDTETNDDTRQNTHTHTHSPTTNTPMSSTHSQLCQSLVHLETLKRHVSHVAQQEGLPL